jgi:hypothetical protein
MTRPAVEWRIVCADLHSPKPAAILRSTTDAIDPRGLQSANQKTPIVFDCFNRAINVHEARPLPFEDSRRFRRIGRRWICVIGHERHNTTKKGRR